MRGWVSVPRPSARPVTQPSPRERGEGARGQRFPRNYISRYFVVSTANGKGLSH
jgi:hypothetical protein